MSFVALDLGASNTRFTNNSGKISTMPNNVVFVEDFNTKQAIMEPVDIKVNGNEIYDALEVLITRDNDNTGFYPMHALIGTMAESYSTNNEYPNGLVNKTKQRINYLSSIVSIAISKITTNLTDDIEVYLALPPTELREVKEAVKEKLVGSYEVTFVKFNNNTSVKFNIVDVKCAEESAMAVTSFFFDLKGAIREQAKPYLNGTVLSIDIGASTTDLAVIKKGEFLDKSGRSYKVGGNIARDYLIEKVLGAYSYDIPFEDADKTMTEGRLKFGNSTKDVSQYINEAKRTVAKSLVTYMNTYFGSIKIPIQTINAIVVSGGGSMSSQYINEDNEIVITSQPMSTFITEEISDICDGIVVENHSDNPRFANIFGLYLKAQFDAVNGK